MRDPYDDEGLTRGSDPYEVDEEYEYLDVKRHDNGIELWTLANIFENMKPGEDTRYRDFHLAITNNWKVVSFEISRWNGLDLSIDIDLFAVRR